MNQRTAKAYALEEAVGKLAARATEMQSALAHARGTVVHLTERQRDAATILDECLMYVRDPYLVRRISEWLEA